MRRARQLFERKLRELAGREPGPGHAEPGGEVGEVGGAAVLRAYPRDDVVLAVVLLDIAHGKPALADPAGPRGGP